MIKKLTLLLFLATIANAKPHPFDLNIDKIYTSPPVLPGYSVWKGNVKAGLVYLREKDTQLDYEVEIHIYLRSGKINKLIFIFGPSGIENTNCIRFYKDVVASLRKKYGNYTNTREVRDPILDDLVLGTKCTHVRMGAYSLEVTWLSTGRVIRAYLFGDDSGIYVEIEYSFGSPNRGKHPAFRDF